MTNPASTQPLRSLLENDPDMGELIDLYVSDLSARVQTLEDAWGAKQFDHLRRIAHQLRGASAGYGFPTIGQAAGTVEDSIKGRSPEQVDATAVQRQVNELVSLCQRAIAGRA